MTREVSDDRGHEPDRDDRHHKACVPAKDISGGHEGEYDFPEESEEVHDVVEDRWGLWDAVDIF